MTSTSQNRFIHDDESIFLQYFANESTLKQWQERFDRFKTTPEVSILEKALPTVMLANEYQIRQNVAQTRHYLGIFKDLVADAFNLLHSAMKNSGHERNSGAIQKKKEKNTKFTCTCDSPLDESVKDPEPKEKTPRERKIKMVTKYNEYQKFFVTLHFQKDPNQSKSVAADDKQDFANAITFVTAHYVVCRGNLALLQADASDKPDWMSFCKFAHWLATQYLRSQKKVDILIANSMRLSIARLMFNCAMIKTIYEHKFLVKAFQYFEGVIERKIHSKTPIRRVDSNIKPSEWSIISILNMAACLSELRSPQKCRDLIGQARKLLARFSDKDTAFAQYKYLKAYADYIEGVSHFEDTSPLRSGLNRSSKDLNPEFLNTKYSLAKSCLQGSVAVLREHFRSDPLTASAVTMLSVVSVNSAGKFSDEVLQKFEESLDLECALETGTVTATSLLQILHVGANLQSDLDNSTKCQELYDRASLIIKRKRNIGRELTPSEDFSSEKTSVGSSETASKQLSCVKSSVVCENPTWATILRTVEDSKRFLDGHQLESLAHLKNLLHELTDIQDIPARVLCILCVSRHYLNAQSLFSARQQQHKAAHLLNVGFGIELDSSLLDRIIFDEFKSTFPEDHRFLVFLVTFWLVNEGLILLEQAAEEHQKTRAASLVPIHHAISWTEQAVAMLSSIFSKAHNVWINAFKKTSWVKALECLNHAKGLVQEMKSDIAVYERTAFVFVEDYLADAFFKLDKMLSVDNMYRTNPKLIYCVTELLKDVDEYSHGLEQSSRATAADSTATDLMLCLHKAQVNFPELVQLTELLPYQFNKTQEEPEDDCNLDVVFVVTHHLGKLRILQQACDLCQAAGLVDTELYAIIHMHAGIELLQQAFRDPTRPPYSTLNGAILKFRKAARILELLHPVDVKTAHCYMMLGFMYRYHAQLEDQQQQCIRCLEKCLSIEKRLVVKETTPSPWLWKGLEIVEFFQKYFDQISKDFSDCTSFSEDLELWNELNLKFQTALYRNKPLFYLRDFGAFPLSTSSLLAEGLTDPLSEWEEKRNRSLKAIAVMMRDRLFPEDSPPSDTEIRCYAQYLTKLFDRHLVVCPVPNQPKPEDKYKCPLDKLKGSEVVKRNDFLRGMNIYPQSSAQVKISIIKQLQQDHNRLLKECAEARKYHDSYEVAY